VIPEGNHHYLEQIIKKRGVEPRTFLLGFNNR